MIIRGASLVNRFYISDGWTTEKVAELLSTPKDMAKKIACVSLRCFRNYSGPASRDMYIPTYFAVYENKHPAHNPEFDAKKVLEHEYIPYRSAFGHEGFGTKNRVRVSKE